MYYTYLLFNTKTRKFYIGFTSDLVKRYEQHLAWNNESTAYESHSWKLVYYESYLSESDARNREIKLKNHGRWIQEIKKRIENSLEEL